MSESIPTKESKHSGIPVTDVESAQKALLESMRASKEQPNEIAEETETQEAVSEQAMEVAESVENEVVDTQELTTDDLVDDNQQEQVSEPRTYTVKIDGKDTEVTEDELLSGYSRQADYTRKSQVLAEQRKKMDEELAATQQERQQYQSQLEQFNLQADSKLEEFKSVDWVKLKEEDPMEYALKRDQYRELQENKRLVAEEQQILHRNNKQKCKQSGMKNLQDSKKLWHKDCLNGTTPKKGLSLNKTLSLSL